MMYLSSHLTGPFLSPHPGAGGGAVLEIYSTDANETPACQIESVKIVLDWRATFGRIGRRYWMSVIVYVVGVSALLLFTSISHPSLSLSAALRHSTRKHLPTIALVLTVLATLPAPRYAMLGNSGEILFAWVPALCLGMAYGMVWMIVGGLKGLVAVMRRLRGGRGAVGSRGKKSHHYHQTSFHPRSKRYLGTACVLVLGSTFFFPVQVLYLVVLVRQFWRCVSLYSNSDSDLEIDMGMGKMKRSPPPSLQLNSVSLDEVPMGTDCQGGGDGDLPMATSSNQHQGWKIHRPNSISYDGCSPLLNESILVLSTSLFPLTMPVVVVWIRTLLSSPSSSLLGILFVPFPGDHNIFKILGLLGFVEWVGRCGVEPQPMGRVLWRKAVSALLATLAAFCFLLGPRFSYGVLMMSTFVGGIVWILGMVLRRREG